MNDTQLFTPDFANFVVIKVHENRSKFEIDLIFRSKSDKSQKVRKEIESLQMSKNVSANFLQVILLDNL